MAIGSAEAAPLGTAEGTGLSGSVEFAPGLPETLVVAGGVLLGIVALRWLYNKTIGAKN